MWALGLMLGSSTSEPRVTWTNLPPERPRRGTIRRRCRPRHRGRFQRTEDSWSPSLTHIAQVCRGRTIKHPVDAKPRTGIAHVLEETPPAAEQHGCQGDFQLVDDA